MNTSHAVTEISEILTDLADVDPAAVTADAELNADLGVDSLLMVEVTVTVEERFGITIPDEIAAEFTTVGDIATFATQAAAA